MHPEVRRVALTALQSTFDEVERRRDVVIFQTIRSFAADIVLESLNWTLVLDGCWEPLVVALSLQWWGWPWAMKRILQGDWGAPV